MTQGAASRTSSGTSSRLEEFIRGFRLATPYVHKFRGRTFVIAFGGEVVEEDAFWRLAHDLNCLVALGIRVVLVHGARPQIERELREQNAAIRYAGTHRITDAAALRCVKHAAGQVRVDIEALLSQGLPNSPMAYSELRVASGNFVTARPLGVCEGVDLLHTGEVRKIAVEAIRQRLDAGELVLLSPIGYSPSGEVFNLTLEDVAAAAAIALRADKLMFLMDQDGVVNAQGALLRELTTQHAAQCCASLSGADPGDVAFYLPAAVRACQHGVAKTHLISRHLDGALLAELFTRDGVGTMVSRDPIETLRAATVDDVGRVLSIIEPLEEAGVLVRRGRERLEMEIGYFSVLEHDNVCIGCVALYPYPEQGMAELACLAVDPAARDGGRGEALLHHVEAHARAQGLKAIFVLTTRTAHWFIERGFAPAEVADLPVERQQLYNYQRRSKVFVKPLA